MKMTLRIDEKLLASVMAEHDFQTKTEAVHAALKEMDRQARVHKFAEEGLGMSSDELKRAVDPDYDLLKLRQAELLRRG